MCQLFTALNLINNVMNNVFFLVFSMLIDVGLVRFTNANLARKRRLFTKVNYIQDLNQAHKLKEKVTKMIITNGLLYFVSHVPEFTVTILMLVFEKQIWYSCIDKMQCTELIEITQTFNLISMSCQIFVFTNFDKNIGKSVVIAREKMQKGLLIYYKKWCRIS